MKRENMLLLLVGVIIGLAVTLFFSSDPVMSDVDIQPELTKNHTQEAEKNYQQAIDSITQHETGIKLQLDTAKGRLLAVQKQNREFRVFVNGLANAKNAMESKDTITLLNSCDSLKSTVVLLIRNDSLREDIRTEIDSMLNSQLLLKETEIKAGQERYLVIRQSFHRAQAQLQLTALQIANLKKQVRKQSWKNKLGAAAACIVGGLVAGILLTN